MVVAAVICEDGHSYDRASIEHWFQSCRADGRTPTSPKTNARLTSTRLIPNITLRGAIQDYKDAMEKLRGTLVGMPEGGDTEAHAIVAELQPEPGAAAWAQQRQGAGSRQLTNSIVTTPMLAPHGQPRSRSRASSQPSGPYRLSEFSHMDYDQSEWETIQMIFRDPDTEITFEHLESYNIACPRVAAQDRQRRRDIASMHSSNGVSATVDSNGNASSRPGSATSTTPLSSRSR